LILIKNAIISPESQETRDILIRGGKIERIKKNIDDPGAEVIDAKRRLVTHGLVGYFFTCHGESNRVVTPNIRAIEEVDILGKGYEKYLRRGITTVVSPPKNNNLIGGSMCVVKTRGVMLDRSVIKEDAALKVSLGGDSGLGERMASIREFIGILGNYRRGELVTEDIRIKLMEKFLKRKLPIIFQAESSLAVLNALRLIKKYNLVGAIETPVDTREVVKAARDQDVYLIRGMEAPEKESHRYIDVIERLKGENKEIARFLNIDHRIGSLKEGTDADIVVWERDEDEIYVKTAMVDGNIINFIHE